MTKSLTNSSPHIALIGGGTGSFTLLKKLKNYTPYISAIVNMSDDGGSTGRLRDEQGVLPPGDIRQCLVALACDPRVRDLFDFRFDKGDLAGHSAGNIILTALELKYGDFIKAVSTASSILNITGEVIPVTTQNHELVMSDGDKLIVGEFKINTHKIISDSPRVHHAPKAVLNESAKKAIMSADLVVVAPGNLYASLLPALSVDGMAEALAKTKAKKVMVTNLVNKPNQTKDWHVVDYLNEVESYVGGGVIDYLLYNTSLPDRDLLKKYAQDGEYPVSIEKSKFNMTNAELIGTNLLASGVHRQDSADKAIKRTLIRHDGNKVSRQLMKIFYS
jgi:uncharacterized cofD-like protein